MKNKKARWSLLSAFTAFTTYFERVKLSVNKKKRVLGYHSIIHCVQIYEKNRCSLLIVKNHTHTHILIVDREYDCEIACSLPKNRIFLKCFWALNTLHCSQVLQLNLNIPEKWARRLKRCSALSIIPFDVQNMLLRVGEYLTF